MVFIMNFTRAEAWLRAASSRYNILPSSQSLSTRVPNDFKSFSDFEDISASSLFLAAGGELECIQGGRGTQLWLPAARFFTWDVDMRHIRVQ